jgi:hypothetical protein
MASISETGKVTTSLSLSLSSLGSQEGDFDSKNSNQCVVVSTTSTSITSNNESMITPPRPRRRRHGGDGRRSKADPMKPSSSLVPVMVSVDNDSTTIAVDGKKKPQRIDHDVHHFNSGPMNVLNVGDNVEVLFGKWVHPFPKSPLPISLNML